MTADISAQKAKSFKEQIQLGDWKITSMKSHILESEGIARQRFEAQLRLPQVPEMIFADNKLRIEHADGYGIEFNAHDALKLVDAEHDLLKVAAAQAWREARAEVIEGEEIMEVIKPFDWTFTTNYTGTLFKGNSSISVEPTEENINIEKLKQKEKILFYEDLTLFEDELSDNGASLLGVKIRAMPSCFLALLRFYLRVDDVLVRINDTRLYHEWDKPYMIREYTSKEATYAELKVPRHLLTDPNEIGTHLKLKQEIREKLVFPPRADVSMAR